MIGKELTLMNEDKNETIHIDKLNSSEIPQVLTEDFIFTFETERLSRLIDGKHKYSIDKTIYKTKGDK